MKAFCPGHITCFFQPVRSDDMLTTGSLGVGIRIDKGSTVTVDERSDRKIAVTMDGQTSDAKITKAVLELLAPGRGFDVTVVNDLPISQGFGMSAAGAISTGLCICQMLGIDENEAYKAAHVAEIREGGGLGDVAGIMGKGPISARIKAGFPPAGVVESSGSSENFTLAVIGESMGTKGILNDAGTMQRIAKAGENALSQYHSPNDMFRLSRRFSSDAGLETSAMSAALSKLGERAAMCMLGNSIFTSLPMDVVEDLMSDAEIFECRSTTGKSIIRRA